MTNQNYKKYLISKIAEVVKFCFALGLLSFLITKAPNEAAQIVTTAGAFILGGSKVRSKLGF